MGKNTQDQRVQKKTRITLESKRISSTGGDSTFNPLH